MKLTCIFLTFCSVSLVRSSVEDSGSVGISEELLLNVTSPVVVSTANQIPRNDTSGPRSPVMAPETVPDDYLNWFFHHSFKKLDEFFQSENDKETPRDTSDDLTGTANNWKVRVSKVILKLVLIFLAIVGSILFILGVFLLMLLSFLVSKFLCHVLQCCQERKKPKNNSTTYQVNV